MTHSLCIAILLFITIKIRKGIFVCSLRFAACLLIMRNESVHSSLQGCRWGSNRPKCCLRGGLRNHRRCCHDNIGSTTTTTSISSSFLHRYSCRGSSTSGRWWFKFSSDHFIRCCCFKFGIKNTNISRSTIKIQLGLKFPRWTNCFFRFYFISFDQDYGTKIFSWGTQEKEREL